MITFIPFNAGDRIINHHTSRDGTEPGITYASWRSQLYHDSWRVMSILQIKSVTFWSQFKNWYILTVQERICNTSEHTKLIFWKAWITMYNDKHYYYIHRVHLYEVHATICSWPNIPYFLQCYFRILKHFDEISEVGKLTYCRYSSLHRGTDCLMSKTLCMVCSAEICLA